MGRTRIRRDESFAVALNQGDQELILEHTLIDGPVGSRITLGEVAGGNRIRVHLTPDELEELLEVVAAASNHESDRRIVRRLESLYDRLESIERALDVYE